MPDSLWTVDQVAEYLGMTRDWVYREVREERLPHFKVGARRVRFRKDAIDRYLASRERGTRKKVSNA